MTLKRELLSPEGAFLRSIVALKGDGWQRLSDQFRIPISTLYRSANPAPTGGRTSIRLEWLEWLDLTNEREGTADPINHEAWLARHRAALEGVELPPTTPATRYSRAVVEIKAGNADLEQGKDGNHVVHDLLMTLGELVSTGLRIWSRRERDTAARNRRAGDKASGADLPSQVKPEPEPRPKLRAVERGS